MGTGLSDTYTNALIHTCTRHVNSFIVQSGALGTLSHCKNSHLSCEFSEVLVPATKSPRSCRSAIKVVQRNF